jgi:DNA (cytosine-5)-methyltransferase 1
VNYYNEIDPKAAQWLRELIAAGLIPPGNVDERSIVDVRPADLRGYTQCHFFAGIGGWSYALQLAGWPADRTVWTGSCPCQPFSAAGKRMGKKDSRHLWPAFRRLINQCAPPIVFGEQVASKDGRVWLAGVFANLETMGYAAAGADLCAASVGAPHIRQRLYWVAYAASERWNRGAALQREVRRPVVETSSPLSGLADMQLARLEGHGGNGDDGNQPGRNGAHEAGSTAEGGSVGRVAIPSSVMGQCGSDESQRGQEGRDADRGNGAWADFELVWCRDKKFRRIEPGTFPLAHGVSGRVGLLRGYGNAIVPQVAAEFIRSVMEL